MRKIETQMLEAVNTRKNFSKDNTVVWFILSQESEISGSRSEVFLHGNSLGEYWHESKDFAVNVKTLREWPTVTTLSRLRALGVNVCQKRGVIYLDGRAM